MKFARLVFLLYKMNPTMAVIRRSPPAAPPATVAIMETLQNGAVDAGVPVTEVAASAAIVTGTLVAEGI